MRNPAPQLLTSLLALAGVFVAVPCIAQVAPAYRAVADTMWFEARNPHRLFWVNGPDTLGRSRQDRSVERHVWLRASDGTLILELQRTALGVDRAGTTPDSYTMAPDGGVILVNGEDPRHTRRVDVLPRLPATPFVAGLTWSDSLTSGSADTAEEYLYEVRRTYRLVRFLDTLGASAVEVAAEGTVRYRDGWWADSAAGLRNWLDVSGPITESFWFDPRRGRLLAHEWQMELRGTGGYPAYGVGTDTLPAGLTSAESRSMIPGARGTSLARAIPEGDTTYTVLGADDRQRFHVSSGDLLMRRSALARPDGALGLATARYDSSGRAVEHQVVWIDSLGVESRSRLYVDEAGIHVVAGAITSDVAAPSERWGVADYGMDDLLTPTLLTLPRDIRHPWSVYRPAAGRWDEGVVVVQAIPELVVAVAQFGDGDVVIYNVKPDGELLMWTMGESNRVPPYGSAAWDRLEALMERLRGGE